MVPMEQDLYRLRSTNASACASSSNWSGPTMRRTGTQSGWRRQTAEATRPPRARTQTTPARSARRANAQRRRVCARSVAQPMEAKRDVYAPSSTSVRPAVVISGPEGARSRPASTRWVRVPALPATHTRSAYTRLREREPGAGRILRTGHRGRSAGRGCAVQR
jgi:hypothetical protein